MRVALCLAALSALLVACDGDAGDQSEGGGGEGGGPLGEGGSGGGSDHVDCPDEVPAEGDPCSGIGSCAYTDVLDACGVDQEPFYECDGTSFTFGGGNLNGCFLECPGAAPTDGDACDPEADGTYCEYEVEGETLLAECEDTATWSVAPLGSEDEP